MSHTPSSYLQAWNDGYLNYFGLFLDFANILECFRAIRLSIQDPD